MAKIVGALQTLRVQGNTLAFVLTGNAQTQEPPLVLLHGFPLHHGMWVQQIESFAADRLVIACDLAGFGQSAAIQPAASASDDSKGPNLPPPYTMRRYADDVQAVLQGVLGRRPVALCGLSMGGYIALEFACAHREHLAALVLTNTKTAADSAETAEGRLKIARHVVERGPNILLETMLPRLVGSQTKSNNAPLVESLRQMIVCADSQAIAAAQQGMAQRTDYRGKQRLPAMPTLVMAAEEDVITPVEEMRAMASDLDAECVVIQGAGHLAPWEQPDAWNAALRQFLEAIS